MNTPLAAKFGTLLLCLMSVSCDYRAHHKDRSNLPKGDISSAPGIALDIRNPYGRIKYCDGYVYSSGASMLVATADGSLVTEWGGVQRINVETYEKDSVIYGNHRISDVAIVSSTQGYLIEYLDWGNSAVKRFNPSAGEVQENNVAGLGDGDSGP